MHCVYFVIKIRDDRVHFKKERRSSESLVLMRDLEQNEVNTYKTKIIILNYNGFFSFETSLCKESLVNECSLFNSRDFRC